MRAHLGRPGSSRRSHAFSRRSSQLVSTRSEASTAHGSPYLLTPKVIGHLTVSAPVLPMVGIRLCRSGGDEASPRRVDSPEKKEEAPSVKRLIITCRRKLRLREQVRGTWMPVLMEKMVEVQPPRTASGFSQFQDPANAEMVLEELKASEREIRAVCRLPPLRNGTYLSTPAPAWVRRRDGPAQSGRSARPPT